MLYCISMTILKVSYCFFCRSILQTIDFTKTAILDCSSVRVSYSKIVSNMYTLIRAIILELVLLFKREGHDNYCHVRMSLSIIAHQLNGLRKMRLHSFTHNYLFGK